MGKVPKLKSRTPSSRSRAGRRAASPSAEIDKSLDAAIDHADGAADAGNETNPSVLAARHGSGVTKKAKKQKPLSRQQRLRKERGMVMADAVVDKLEAKVKRSKDKGRLVKSRNADWEDLNSQISQRKPLAKRASRKAQAKLDASRKNATGTEDIVAQNASKGHAEAGEEMGEIDMKEAAEDAWEDVEEDVT